MFLQTCAENREFYLHTCFALCLLGKLPKWFGERPGKKKDDPETPEEEEVKKPDDDLNLDVSLRNNYEEEEEEEEEEVRDII